MKFGVKSGFNKEQIELLLQQGLPYIEFHTEVHDLDGSVDFHEIRALLDKYNVKCHAVHSPIKDENGRMDTLCIGTLFPELRKRNLEYFKKSIEAAQILCGIDNPIVVSHIGTCYTFNNDNINNLTKEDISNALKEASTDLSILNRYIDLNCPNIQLVVENMPTYTFEKELGVFSWYFGYNNDLPTFIKDLNLPHIKTCLDVCHAQMHLNTLRLINPFDKSVDITTYLDYYKSTIGLIHLNNCIDLGEVVSNHSQPFLPSNRKDIDYLKRFFNKYIELGIDCYITLEINETDYYKRENSIATIQTLKIVADELNNTAFKKALLNPIIQ